MNDQPNLRDRIHAGLRLGRLRAVKLARLLRSRSYRQALREGVAASVEHSVIPFDEGIQTVLDVGASRGQFALFAAHRFPEARIICFEPQPGPMTELNEVLGDRVEKVPLAIGSAPGTASMNISRRDDSSSLLPIGSKQSKVFPGTESVDSLEVEVTTLDAALPDELARPCLLKIDVQGLELEVLKGATGVLPQVDEALIEGSFIELYEGQALADDVITVMKDAGLRLAGTYGKTTDADGRDVQADFFFRRLTG